jgi:hypothetical protein
VFLFPHGQFSGSWALPHRGCTKLLGMTEKQLVLISSLEKGMEYLHVLPNK